MSTKSVKAAHGNLTTQKVVSVGGGGAAPKGSNIGGVQAERRVMWLSQATNKLA